jgi:two-component system LytT family sensor kinase
MLIIKKKDWIEIVIHLAFWIGVFYTLTALSGSHIKVTLKQNGLIRTTEAEESIAPFYYLNIIFLMILFYGNVFWIFKKALLFRRIFSRITAAGGWFLLIYVTNFFIVGSLLNLPHQDLPPVPPSLKINEISDNVSKHPIGFDATYFALNGWAHMQITILFIFLTVLGLSIGYFFLKEWARNELIRNQLMATQYSTEIKFLKSQINPHFLFNTLNNLFSMAQGTGNDELAEGISKLSGMMRYMIYESNEEVVPLRKEIECLENCILLNKLRFADDEANVRFNFPVQSEGISIAPMLFIPFVENAFKHGVAIGQPSQIDIDISVKDRELTFTCQNSIYDVRKMEDGASGIGLENVRRRLVLVYPDKHALIIKNHDGKYLVQLKINLE